MGLSASTGYAKEDVQVTVLAKETQRPRTSVVPRSGPQSPPETAEEDDDEELEKLFRDEVLKDGFGLDDDEVRIAERGKVMVVSAF